MYKLNTKRLQNSTHIVRNNHTMNNMEFYKNS